MNENFIEIAKNLETSGKYAKALEFYIKELESDSKNVIAYDGAAMCLFELRRLDDAYDMSIKSTEINADRVEPYLTRVYIYSYKNKFREAFEQAQLAFKREPGAVDVLQSYGVALLQIGQIDEGISVLERALLIQPESTFIHVNLAFGYNQKRDFKKQIFHSRAVFSLRPSIKTGLYLISAFENKYGLILTILIYVFMLITYLTRELAFLAMPIFYILYKIPFGIFAIQRRDFRHAKAIGVVLFLIASPVIYFLLFYK